MTDIQTQVFNCQDRAEKKQLLKALSKQAKAIIELNGLDKNVNAVLIDMYTNEMHTEFKTFRGWTKENKKVKKGEKGFFVWSKKLKAADKTEGAEEDKEFKFFGIAYLFSNAQVEPLKK
ncbi:ArdC-like ssDNA-binding domain-containing protein [Polaribacter atrinae]|uniref:ArdC-like ssDNA-binding domain-containing protein n=1 Tax=Polaribacter atrinae TaxID=1333662 RepID=UPI0030F910C8